MESTPFDEDAFFAALASSGARVLLIGRRAMVALGLPVLTADYDLWVHFDDVERLNAALEALDHHTSLSPAEARARGRYFLENDEHVDVMVARAASAQDGRKLTFDDAWQRRELVEFSASGVHVPRPEDLIVTKTWAMRPKDVSDIRMLESLVRARSKP